MYKIYCCFNYSVDVKITKPYSTIAVLLLLLLHIQVNNDNESGVRTTSKDFVCINLWQS